MTSILKVSEIQDPTNSNTALTIDTSGNVTASNNLKVTGRPAFGARGYGTNNTLPAASSNFLYIDSWTVTDFNQGGLLTSGGYAEVPTGWAGIYNISFRIGWISSANYTSALVFWYDASSSTYTNVMENYSLNDYQGYVTGGSIVLNLGEGDRIYAGFHASYGTPATGAAHEHGFNMFYVG